MGQVCWTEREDKYRDKKNWCLYRKNQPVEKNEVMEKKHHNDELWVIST